MELQAAKTEHTFEPGSSTEARTILVVEDFTETRFILRISLEMSGYRVLEATNGLEAVEVARRERPDLILMDIGLPLMNGFEAARAIREDDDLAGVPIVAVSAHATAEYRVKAVAVGCTEYVTKPIDLCRLGTIVKSLMA